MRSFIAEWQYFSLRINSHKGQNIRVIFEARCEAVTRREREVADKFQKLILEELHHCIKNTLATVSAIVSQREAARARGRSEKAGYRIHTGNLS